MTRDELIEKLRSESKPGPGRLTLGWQSQLRGLLREALAHLEGTEAPRRRGRPPKNG